MRAYERNELAHDVAEGRIARSGVPRPLMKRAMALGAVLMLAGCGGSSKSKPSPSVAFLARAEAICVREHKRVGALIRESGERSATADIDALRTQTARELSALKPPPALKAPYLQLVSSIAHEAALRRRVDLELRKHEYTAGLLASLRKLRGNSVSRPARLTGLTDCL